MTKKERKEQYKQMNGWNMTPLQRATDSVRRAEVEVQKALEAGNQDYADMYIELIKGVCASHNITSQYAQEV
jgi:hypothetical protein